MQEIMSMLGDPKMLLGIAALVILFIVFVFVAFPSKKPKREAAPVQTQVEEKREFSAEALVHELLSDRRWRLATLDQISNLIGGYKDDELRQLLVRAGAVRLSAKDDADETWGLLDSNRRKLIPAVGNAEAIVDEPKSTLLKPKMPKILSQAPKMPIFGSKAPSKPETKTLSDTPAEPDYDDKPKNETVD